MNLGNVIEDWTGFVSIFLRKVPSSWLSLLLLLTSSAALFLSSSFFSFTVLIPKQENVPTSSTQRDKNGQEQEQERGLDQQEREMSFLDESESSTNTDDSEYVETTTDDGSISDEESLIELSLPSGHYMGQYYGDHDKGEEDDDIKGYRNKNQMYNLRKKNIQDLRLFELLAEFNGMVEEDNLIEIDISIGSIKCSRFEITA
ncbi:PREDICTED: uncharacterized protein LOC104808845 [Tarenaya hassleriana]|uniref:uncharacterized protein LOC104808845 n=1 Tax=Tarenaya hassleriana TaxID=28532 RepID=UPI00053C15AD|nr:PREDICTED: uncharacterized protein LOC104808845 [Tarenaya hassleriana]